MALLKQYDGCLYVAVGDQILIHNYSGSCAPVKSVKLPEIIIPENLSVGQTEVLKREDKQIISLSVNKEYILATTQNKQVVLFDAKLQVIKNFVLNRAASKVRLGSNNDILIADKTGDAFVCEFNKDTPALVLGHLSMLLDILIEDKYIITCDRDEKIRVSHYPNCYNILSYCLGHKEFVTNIEIFNGLLVSASGDGTVRFWDYKSGRQIGIVNCNDFIKDKNVIEQFCLKMDQDNVEVRALPITDMQVHGNYVAVSLLGLNYIQIYSAVWSEDSLDVKHLQNVNFDSQLVNFSLRDRLIILTSDKLLCYECKGDKYEFQSDLNQFYDDNKELITKSSKDDFSVYYKRKFDNVQEYLERKKLRLEGGLNK
ncbi:PREDICTED: tRNA (guanine-N(7)-)-methyltransferase non-catalytic subunit wuho [Nicrophorus vespilloides]|uniref:tRNA (Guanine-N(7)-)-methyltransferase non-catalytic subunit wuho n=1 Tax=Nicrophorus vespilloides TaxID=110193 RepID=A0ABM1MTY0_NICVS|nr:PREDICTED: tRNA (guanine-N(7)-)-methyltransferase non-catalytic subunit wuho [Nicrophorus vespilloides]